MTVVCGRAFEGVCLCSGYVYLCACAFVFTMEPLYCDTVFDGCEDDILVLVLDNSSMMLTSATSVMQRVIYYLPTPSPI